MSIKVIGLTGGIGSGKTTVARIFQSFGFEVYFADERSKSVMNTDPEVRKAIVALLGADSYLPDGNANRKYIGQIIFNNKEKLAAINAIMHPAVQQDRLRWLGELEAKGYDRPFALTEAAILFESGAYRHMQGVITVSAPEDLRIERVIAREGATAEQVRARMANQLPEEERLRRADFVIHNDGKEMLIPQVQKAIQFFS